LLGPVETALSRVFDGYTFCRKSTGHLWRCVVKWTYVVVPRVARGSDIFVCFRVRFGYAEKSDVYAIITNSGWKKKPTTTWYTYVVEWGGRPCETNSCTLRDTAWSVGGDTFRLRFSSDRSTRNVKTLLRRTEPTR